MFFISNASYRFSLLISVAIAWKRCSDILCVSGSGLLTILGQQHTVTLIPQGIKSLFCKAIVNSCSVLQSFTIKEYHIALSIHLFSLLYTMMKMQLGA